MSNATDATSEQATEGGIWAQAKRGWRRLRQPWWARWLIDLTLVVALFAGTSWYQTRNLVDSGQKLPATTLQSIDGEAEPLVDPDAERTLVYAWAPWCGVCSAETGTVNWASSWLGDGVAVRSVVFDHRSPEHARRSADQKGAEFPVLLGDRSLRETLDVRAFPTFYVLSREGRVVTSTAGYTTTLGLLWRSWW